jgi:hypothetical protein
VTNPEDTDDANLVCDFIKDAVVSDADSIITFGAGEFQATVGPGIV